MRRADVLQRAFSSSGFIREGSQRAQGRKSSNWQLAVGNWQSAQDQHLQSSAESPDPGGHAPKVRSESRAELPAIAKRETDGLEEVGRDFRLAHFRSADVAATSA